MVTEYLSRFFSFGRYFRPRNRRPSRCSIFRNSDHALQYLSPWESNMTTLQSVLIWEKPEKSVIAILLVNLLYWYLVYSDIQLYFGLSLLGLVSFLHHQWTCVIWPEISVPNLSLDQEEWTPVHPRILSAPELSRYLRNCMSYIQEQLIRLTLLRRKQPASFCAIMVGACCFLWMVGYFVPGVILLYSLFMCFMCLPGFVIHCVPENALEHLKNIINDAFKFNNEFDNDEDIKEFLPEECSQMQKVLKIPLSSAEAGQETGPRSTTAKSKKRKRALDASLYGKEESSFTFGLSENDFALGDEGDSDEADISVPRFDETPRITSDFSDGEMSFDPGHFADTDQDEDSYSDYLVRNPQPMDVAAQNPSNVTAFVMSYVNGAAVEQTAALLSDFGHRVANVLGSSPSEPPTEMSTSGSSLDEDFELIADENIQ